MFVRNSVFNANGTVLSELKMENKNKQWHALGVWISTYSIDVDNFEKVYFRQVGLNCFISYV